MDPEFLMAGFTTCRRRLCFPYVLLVLSKAWRDICCRFAEVLNAGKFAHLEQEKSLELLGSRPRSRGKRD